MYYIISMLYIYIIYIMLLNELEWWYIAGSSSKFSATARRRPSRAQACCKNGDASKMSMSCDICVLFFIVVVKEWIWCFYTLWPYVWTNPLSKSFNYVVHSWVDPWNIFQGVWNHQRVTHLEEELGVSQEETKHRNIILEKNKGFIWIYRA